MYFSSFLPNILKQDIFILKNGDIYLRFKGSMLNIGTTANTIAQLKQSTANHV